MHCRAKTQESLQCTSQWISFLRLTYPRRRPASVRLVVQEPPLSQTSTEEAVLKSDLGMTEGHGMSKVCAMSPKQAPQTECFKQACDTMFGSNARFGGNGGSGDNSNDLVMRYGV